MKTTRIAKKVLLAAVAMALLGWLTSDFATSPKARASRISTTHNIVTMSFTLPDSANSLPTPASNLR